MLRSESYARTATLWPYGGVPYSQSRRWMGLYRQDCSGFVSGLWALPVDAPGSWGGYSTVTLLSQGIMHEIPASRLKRGDAIGICGPQTGGSAGHITWFERWYNTIAGDNRYWMWEQAGGIWGPRRRLVTYPFGSWKAYQLNTMVDDPTSFLHRLWPAYMPMHHYFGMNDGTNASHSGYFSTADRGYVKAIQERCNAMGFWCGIADGLFGTNTKNGVSNWQKAKYANFTTRFGEVWNDDWQRLFTY